MQPIHNYLPLLGVQFNGKNKKDRPEGEWRRRIRSKGSKCRTEKRNNYEGKIKRKDKK